MHRFSWVGIEVQSVWIGLDRFGLVRIGLDWLWVQKVPSEMITQVGGQAQQDPCTNFWWWNWIYCWSLIILSWIRQFEFSLSSLEFQYLFWNTISFNFFRTKPTCKKTWNIIIVRTSLFSCTTSALTKNNWMECHRRDDCHKTQKVFPWIVFLP